MKIDIKEIEKILKLLEKYSDIDLFELEDKEGKIKVSKGFTTIEKQKKPVFEELAINNANITTKSTQMEPSDISKNSEILNNPKMKAVKAPLVGTFYRAPSPEAKPYVKEGQKVQKGTVICIIEAMKLMNEIECEYDGILHSILIQNGQPVEFGEILFIIETP